MNVGKYNKKGGFFSEGDFYEPLINLKAFAHCIPLENVKKTRNRTIPRRRKTRKITNLLMLFHGSQEEKESG